MDPKQSEVDIVVDALLGYENTIKKLQEIFNAYKHNSYFRIPRICCADGASLSVQVGDGLYCSPRDNVGPWDCVEVGYPEPRVPPTWEEYSDGDSGVYGYVPIKLVAQHGGIHELREPK